LLDPRSDPYWPRFADRLAKEIQKKTGDTAEFWTRLRDFFTDKIEPVWGRTHQGHIYFWLALATLPHDIALGKEELKKSYQEDIALETAKGGRGDEVEERARQHSAYAVLAIVERIEDADFSSQGDKNRFIARLFQSYDFALPGAIVKPARLERALKIIAPGEGLVSCRSIYRKLHEVTLRNLPFATVTLSGSLLESLILADLYYRRKITEVDHGKNAKNILKADLRELLQEATDRSAFSTDSVRVAFVLVHLFRNRLHPGNEIRQTYKLVPRVARTVRVFFEHALVDWSKSFSEERSHNG